MRRQRRRARRIICLDQVADTRNALSYLATRPEVDPERIGLVGSSFGAAVAGVHRRRGPAGGRGDLLRRLGNGERKFRASIRHRRHGAASPTCWRRGSVIANEPADH